ncbi:MAG: ferrous iron transport protein A [Gammaproteobacteria bacterium]|nr:ferrous iron transport protein A [Gammaproteobacteria bacterium]MBU1482233.1 ferrous iron transport protein A [Gammaproteobacteria bacterium]
MSPASFPLMMADAGTCVTVVALLGGAGLDRRMTEMGLNIGAELVVLQRQGGGLVVMRGATRYALGGGMAHKVMVAPCRTPTADLAEAGTLP